MKKIIALVLVTVMALIPLSALAETESYSIRFNNFQLQLNGAEKRPIELDFELNALQSGESLGLNGTARGGDAVIASGQAAIENGDEIKLAMNGLSSNYTVSLTKLMAIAQEQMTAAAADSAMPFSNEDITELMTAYMTLLQNAMAMEENQNLSDESEEKLMEAIGMTKGEPETVTINGKELTLPRYELTISNDNFDSFFELYDEFIPGYSDFMNAYLKFMTKASGLELPEDATISDVFDHMGMDMSMNMVMWFDDSEENMRMEIEQSVTVAVEGEEPQTVTVPYGIEVSTEGANMLMTMIMNIEGEQMVMTMAVNDRAPEDGSDYDFSLTIGAVGSDGNDQFNMTIDGSSEFDAKHVGKFNTELTVEVPKLMRQAFALNVDKTTGNAHIFMSSTTSNLTTESEPEVNSFEFDVSYKERSIEDMPVFDDGGKPSIDLLEMTDEQLITLKSEAKAAMIVAMGSVMQTPGVAEIISELMTAMEVMMVDVSPDVEMGSELAEGSAA